MGLLSHHMPRLLPPPQPNSWHNYWRHHHHPNATRLQVYLCCHHFSAWLIPHSFNPFSLFLHKSISTLDQQKGMRLNENKKKLNEHETHGDAIKVYHFWATFISPLLPQQQPIQFNCNVCVHCRVTLFLSTSQFIYEKNFTYSIYNPMHIITYHLLQPSVSVTVVISIFQHFFFFDSSGLNHNIIDISK